MGCLWNDTHWSARDLILVAMLSFLSVLGSFFCFTIDTLDRLTPRSSSDFSVKYFPLMWHMSNFYDDTLDALTQIQHPFFMS